MYSAFKVQKTKGNKSDMRTVLLQELKGKVGIVTGASAGIGRGIAETLARNGCLLVITGRNEQRLAETKQLCVTNGAAENQVLPVLADMRNETEIKTIMDKTIEKYKKLDFIVNNAGVVHSEILDDTMEKYHEVLQVDLHSVVYLNKLAIPHLEKTKGSIINVSSIAGLRPIPGIVAYATAKAALDQYMRVIALNLAPLGIRVNNVNPGFIKTDIFTHCGFPPGVAVAVWENSTTFNELRRNGGPEEVSWAICFLLSSKACQTTGINLTIDGGFVNMCFNTGGTKGLFSE